MKRAAIALLVVPLIALWLYGCDQASHPVEAEYSQIDAPSPLFAATKIDLCHLNGDGDYVSISISDNAYPAHIEHGDEVAGGGVLDANCQPVNQGPCPVGMAYVDIFCIDRWEAEVLSGVAATTAGVYPLSNISQIDAGTACALAGKRLCSDAEWQRACQGPTTTTYPYGNTYDPTACNEGGGLAGSLDLTGANAACVSAEGVYDMHGNLEEWTSDPNGTSRGGDYVNATINGPGCLNSTTAHTTSYQDATVGFRCCLDPF